MKKCLSEMYQFELADPVEKDTEKWAAGKFLGPSYFETTLVTNML